jgi:dTMP kinase
VTTAPSVPGGDADEPTEPTPALIDPEARPGWHVRMFGSIEFFRLWLTQVVSATGDWLGFLAIAALATRIGAGSAEAAVGVVMAARIVPGFFLGPASGVIADRFDRKKVMVVCDTGRAAVLALLPFVNNVWGLVLASLVMEVFTLLWTPAKEASVPNLVPTEHLTTANSLSLVAAYGTLPLAAGLFSLLSKVAEVLGHFHAIAGLKTDQETIAFFADSATFLFSAFMISRLPIFTNDRRKATGPDGKRIDLTKAFHDLKEGWQFIFVNPVVRAVNVGLATGLIGGGMLVPLGPVFSIRILHAGTAGFGFFIFALGSGVAVGVVLLSVFQKRLPKAEVFAGSLLIAGIALIVAASMSTLPLAALFVVVVGICAGSVYVLGFTLLHESVDDDLRGRIFSALYTLVRFCVLIAFAVGPFLSDLLDKLSKRFLHRQLSLGGISIALPGVRLTLWFAGLVIIAAGVIAVRSIRPEEGEGGLRSLRDEIVSGFTGPITEVKRSHEHPTSWTRPDGEPRPPAGREREGPP